MGQRALYETQRPAISANRECVRELASGSQPYGKPPRKAGVCGALTCGAGSMAFPLDAGMSGNRSPLCVRSTICAVATRPDEAAPPDPSVVMAMEASARSTLQHAITYRAVPPTARNASLRSEVFGDII